MPEPRRSARSSSVARLARVAYMFVVMNCSAVAGVVSAIVRRKVWK